MFVNIKMDDNEEDIVNKAASEMVLRDKQKEIILSVEMCSLCSVLETGKVCVIPLCLKF